MPLIEWNESFSVDIDRIDREHRKLIGLINQLHEAMIEKKAQRAMTAIVTEMVDYAQTHFATEDLYMEEFRYPDLDLHRVEHQKFIEKTDELRRRVSQGEFVLSLEVMRFLRDWLKGHILGTDMKYAPFLKEKGIT
ncbi:MAG TPA: bacteriohemerythrin [Geoalkalibacter subterraneus]|uniref:Bacteriohemerythrin n=1 Tax=Geoalkalibacter subterraneus TaxID=483547 RepID=A0A831PNX4_9BACT|nr:bacteriohemerythrin [Geoalkalibacter subterraneus]